MKRLGTEALLRGLHFLWWLDYQTDRRGGTRG
jgi:hypothetical protein